MANLTIRNLDDKVVKTLKAQAKTHNRSLEAELRQVLTQAAAQRQRMATFRREAARRPPGPWDSIKGSAHRQDRGGSRRRNGCPPPWRRHGP